MEIGPTSGIEGPRPPDRKKIAGVPPSQDLQPGERMDKVELSAEARRMDQIAQMTGIRVQKVQDICRQIARGEYETDQKWDVALGRLTQHLFLLLAEEEQEPE